MTPALVRPIPTVAHPGTVEAMVAVATSQLGYREGRDASGWDNDTIFGQWYGMDRTAWCAIFQSWAAAHSGCADVIPKFAYTPAGADWFRGKGEWGHEPKVGALGFLYGASAGRIHHVFLVTKVNGDGTFLTCEGNTNTDGSAQGDGVYALHRAGVGGSDGGYGYPTYKTVADVQAARVSLTDAQAQARAGAFTGPVAGALKAEGFTADRAGYAKWQLKLGYTGHNADGIPGASSFARLCARHGLTVIN